MTEEKKISNEEIEDFHSAGAYMVNLMNRMSKEDRIKYLKASVGAMIDLVNLEKEEKKRVLEEVRKELFKEEANDGNCSYIG